MIRQPISNRSVIDNYFQTALSVATVVASWWTVRPLGLSGVAGLITALLMANSVLVFVRLVPAGAVSYRAELLTLLSGSVLTSSLLALESLSVAPMFAYLLMGHAGYRLIRNDALVVATLTGVLSSLGLLLVDRLGYDDWPWLLGLTTALPVFLGMANRSRDIAIASALEAATAAQRAAESEARAVGLAERARISRDVHDVLAHSLSGVSMQLELSDMYLETGNVDGARESIGKAHSMVREGMAEARRAVHDSRAEVLPLDRTLSSLFTGVADVRIVGSTVELRTEVTQTLVRVAQESLTNTRRHARGAAVEVELAYLGSQVRLTVSNGSAVDGPDLVSGSGMGLVGMRERVALLDGAMHAGPITDGPLRGGWHVTVTLPV